MNNTSNDQKHIKCNNVWPTEDLPELEEAFKTLGTLMYTVGMKMAGHLGKFLIR